MQVYKDEVQGEQRQQAYSQQTQQVTHFYTFQAASAVPESQSREYQKSGLRKYLANQNSYFILFALLAGSEFLREQGAKHFDDHPEHHGADQDKEEQAHQHNSGIYQKFDHCDTSH